jgi:hypothetical protein
MKGDLEKELTTAEKSPSDFSNKRSCLDRACCQQPRLTIKRSNDQTNNTPPATMQRHIKANTLLLIPGTEKRHEIKMLDRQAILHQHQTINR